MKPLCIYHGNCADGFGAAWAVRRFFKGDCEFHAGVYQNDPPDVSGRDVIFVDFCYKSQIMLELVKSAKSVLVLDHHKSAQEDLAKFVLAAGSTYTQHLINAGQDQIENATRQIYAIFDMNRSGAGITWDYFFGNDTRPPLINHIEDRDLWKFSIPKTREIQAAVFSYPYDFEVWDKLMYGVSLDELAIEGAAIERKHFKDIRELIGVTTRWFEIGGYNVPISNLPYTLTSDAGHILCENNDGVPFAGCYWDTPDGRVFSLRSLDHGLDVADIAKQYGGGGHAHASGFRVPYGHPLAAVS